MLVVDDNAENRALAKATLEDEGLAVVLAATGEEALASFARERADCVLLDVRMPGMDGVAACRRLRELPGGDGVPILFVTAQRDVDTFDRARDAGGDDFITKPYRPSELVARVGAAIQLRRLAVERNELVDVIRRQRDDVMRLQLQKEQLVAFLVHDLKNPVHAIELNGLRITRDPGATERSRDAAAKIRSETQALLRMIMNLLDLSKADEGQLQPAAQRVDLDELLRAIADDMRPRAQAAQVAIEIAAAGVAVHADPELTRRVVENLVDNAIRHAPEDTAVRVTAALAGGAVELRVADAGHGIPAELREAVFERFVRAGGETSRTGRGLGLAFCKLAVETHGGRIWIEDAAPGAVFCVRLPS
ncbi:MAG: response regulator [Deltaproteobacteria bacterium]|nr:response regulator [Deltaproteobacteria bacterium]